MGNAASAFKTLYQRLVRRQRHRDRWVRDDKKKLLPVATAAKKSATHRPLPKRIDEKVFDQLLQQDVAIRQTEDPDWSIHDDLHRRQLAILHCVPSSSSSNQSSVADSFDSMASYVMKGTEAMGVNFYSMEAEEKKKKTTTSSKPYTTESDDEETVRKHYSRIKWKRRFTDDAGRPISPKTDDNETMKAYYDEEGTTTDESDCEDEDNVLDENNGNGDNVTNVVDEEQAAAAAPNEFVLERFEVLVNTCNSFDASWCNDILLS